MSLCSIYKPFVHSKQPCDKSHQGSEGKRVMNIIICHTPALMVVLTAVTLSFLISNLDFRQEA